MEWIKTSVCVVLGLALVGCSPNADQVATPGPDLNQKLGLVKKAMSRAEVMAVLGPPTWLGLPGDKNDYGVRDADTAYILYWRNPGFPVVQVHFDGHNQVRWDSGWSGKETYTHVFEPRDSMSCSDPARAPYCQPE